MALAAFLKAILGAAVVRAAATGSAVVDIAILLSKSVLSRSMKSGRGRSRSSLAMRTRGAISGSTSATGASGRASSCVIARSSWSNRERLAIGTLHALAQFLQRPELKLLDRALAALKFLGHLSNALLLGKAHNNHAALVRWKAIDQLKQRSPLFHSTHALVARLAGQWTCVFPGPAPPSVGNRVGRNPNEPRRKRSSPPLEAFEIRERLVKHLGSYIFGFFAVGGPPRHIGVHHSKVARVKLGELRRVALGGFDQ